ncbi:Transcription factor ILR3 [Camellia lanceoleosa]|uniref:Transcription factor ILR3 n=1 Tax=Camellia lanceoleosa TaxID=1840588 RepID=A0ACC0HEG8_9ERIC|nr:Transcription factor ILR3 [Camellia lanceoleosa]
MEIDPSENSDWFFDYGLIEDVSTVPAGHFTEPPPPPPPPPPCFVWPSQVLNGSSNASVEIDCSFGDSESLKEAGSRKSLLCRLKSESCSVSGSKACREKLRRDKMNERFLELGSVLEPGRPPKTDKTAILSDAVRMVTQLRSEAQKLRESNDDLHEKIKELKAEKTELRDEKQRLKAEKEKLEQQVKGMSAQPGMSGGDKLMPFIGYPGVAMWQFIPPTVRDTSQDHVLRPPVA